MSLKNVESVKYCIQNEYEQKNKEAYFQCYLMHAPGVVQPSNKVPSGRMDWENISSIPVFEKNENDDDWFHAVCTTETCFRHRILLVGSNYQVVKI